MRFMLDTELLKPKYLTNNLFLRLVVYSILFDVVMLFIFHITCPAYTKKNPCMVHKTEYNTFGALLCSWNYAGSTTMKLVFVQQLRHELWYEYCQTLTEYQGFLILD